MKEKNNNEDNLIFDDEEEKIKLIDKRNQDEIKSKDSLLNILKNLERDLIVKNNCKKEFDLRNDNYEKSEKTEVFGHPSCFICLSNYKIDSSIQLFHCSHCDRLFCKSCLQYHYRASFKNIEDSYLKYLKDSGNEDIIDKSFEKDSSKCKLIFFILSICIFNYIYLIPIFAMKPIFTTLETIILNCVKEIFTTKIDDPNSLFNFYQIFFDNANTLNIKFDLMMIMNWLGYRILDSFGFFFTSITFCLINLGLFVALYNFNFLEFNENNKYDIWKFIQLVSCYLLLFVGVGSSSLLSQKIFVDLYKKYDDFKKKDKIKENEKEDKEKENKPNENNKELVDIKTDINEENIINKEEGIDQINKEKEEDNILVNVINTDYRINNIDEKKRLKRAKTRESIIKNRKKTQRTERMNSFFYITSITIFSFFTNFFLNFKILDYKFDEDNEIKKKYNITDLNEIINQDNIDIIQILYEKDRTFFFYTYLIFYGSFMVLSIIIYLLIISCCLITNKRKNAKKIKMQEMNPLIIREEDDSESSNNNLIINRDDLSSSQESIESEDMKMIRQIEEDKNIYNYSICKFCGYFYYSTKSDSRGEYSWCKKCCYCLSDCCCLNCKSLIDCCDTTICNALNIILCNEKDICRCNCPCCYCNKTRYSKVNEHFCFCYKEKRKYKWLHDYITSEVQKDIAPYVLEYFLLGLIIISFQKKFVGLKLIRDDDKKSIFDTEFSFDNVGNIFNDGKILIIIFLSFFLFFLLTMELSRSKLIVSSKRVGKKIQNYLKSNSIFSGIHIILLINSILSLIFSILYYLEVTNLGNYILIPILMYQYFYFSLNYYCVCVNEQRKDHELILSGGILVTIYIKVWNIIYSFAQDFIENEKNAYLFQAVLSTIIIVFFIFYLIFSDFKYIICNNCVNLNLCGFCKICCHCKYNTFCMDGYQYCDCCCCDEESCCYSDSCESCYMCCGCCSCFDPNKKNDILI